MKKIITFCLATVLMSSISFATIRRVGYFGPAVAGVDYSTFQLAHDASTAGDTIMMHPGSEFGNATMTKRLIVIGPGYFLNENAGLQVNPLGMDSASGGTTLTISNATANGSSFIGCTVSYSGINVTGTGVANISFIGCWFSGFNSGAGNPCVTFNQSINNFTFQRCSIKADFMAPASNSVAGTNLAFINCLFYNLPNSNLSYTLFFTSNQPHSGLLQNCIFSNLGGNANLNINLNGGTWVFNNCITNNGNGYIVGAGITYQNCIGTSTQFPAGNGNLQNQTWANIFTLTGSTDAQYTLKAGSPAIGAGIGGANCGIFGGNNPYKLSGIPSVPTLYTLTSPQGNTPTVNTVQINLSTRSNN